MLFFLVGGFGIFLVFVCLESGDVGVGGEIGYCLESLCSCLLWVWKYLLVVVGRERG